MGPAGPPEASGPPGVESLPYAYDPAGSRTADTRNQDPHQYGYDLLDQLTQVQVPKTANKWKTEEAFTYDAVGNRLTDKAQHASQYDAANRLTTDGQFTYAYDANGNLTEKRRLADGAQTHYTYDAEDRLIGVLSPKVEVSFRYDPLGRRTEKRVIRWEDEYGDSTPDPEEEQPPRVIKLRRWQIYRTGNQGARLTFYHNFNRYVAKAGGKPMKTAHPFFRLS